MEVVSLNWNWVVNITGIYSRTNLLKGMTSKSGKKFDAYIEMDEKAETSFVFPEAHSEVSQLLSKT